MDSVREERRGREDGPEALPDINDMQERVRF